MTTDKQLRPDWTEYFLDIAKAVANFANSAGCRRKGPKTSHEREPLISCGLNIVRNSNIKKKPYIT